MDADPAADADDDVVRDPRFAKAARAADTPPACLFFCLILSSIIDVVLSDTAVPINFINFGNSAPSDKYKALHNSKQALLPLTSLSFESRYTAISFTPDLPNATAPPISTVAWISSIHTTLVFLFLQVRPWRSRLHILPNRCSDTQKCSIVKQK